MKIFSGPAKKTRQCIMDSLVILMEDNEFSKIATVDIISKSDVSKSTFYKYFLDKYDLVEQMLDEFHTQLSQLFHQAHETGSTRMFYHSFSQYLNRNYERIRCIFKTKDENIDLKIKFQHLIKQDYLTFGGNRELDAEYFALTSQWSMDYLLTQNRFITDDDIQEIDHKINFSSLLNMQKGQAIAATQLSLAK